MSLAIKCHQFFFFLFFFIEKLYNLLMEIATTPGGGATYDGQSLTSLACSALISLTISLGNTGKLLQAVTALLMSPVALATEDVQVINTF